MGLIRDLISNYANSKIEEQRQKAAQQAQMGELMKTLWADPKAKPEVKAAAQSFYLDLVGKHGGKKGREMLPQIASTMSAMTAMQTMSGLQKKLDEQGMRGYTLPDDQAEAARSLPLSTGGTAGAMRTTGLPTGGTDGASGGGRFRPVLSTLAGVGRGMLGRPRDQPSIESQLPEVLRGPWEMTDEEYAQHQARIKSAGQEIDRQDYFKTIDDDVASGRMTEAEGREAKKAYEAPSLVKTTRASSTLEERDDALKAKADELGKTVDKLTAKEKVEAVQGLRSRTSTSATEQGREDALQAYADELGKPKDQLTAQERIEAVRRASKEQATAKEAEREAQAIADAVERGEQDPNLTGLSRQGLAGRVYTILADRHYNVMQAKNDLYGVRAWIRSMNSPQQLRLAQAINFTSESLDLVDNPKDPGNDMIGRLAKVLPQTKGKYQALNRAFMTAAKNGLFGDQAASDAQNLLTQISDLQSELGTVYMGGNSPTDRGLALAQEQLKGEWSEKVLRRGVDLARTNLRLRLNSIKQSQPGAVSSQGQQQFAPPASGDSASTTTPPGTPPPPPSQGTADDFFKNHPDWAPK